jgi:hypothetical protein
LDLGIIPENFKGKAEANTTTWEEESTHRKKN